MPKQGGDPRAGYFLNHPIQQLVSFEVAARSPGSLDLRQSLAADTQYRVEGGGDVGLAEPPPRTWAGAEAWGRRGATSRARPGGLALHAWVARVWARRGGKG